MTQTLLSQITLEYAIPNCTVIRAGEERQVYLFEKSDGTHFYGYKLDFAEWDGKTFAEPFAQHVRFRIRKLTPRECFRLMDVSEGDIDLLMTTQLVPRKKGSDEMVEKFVVSKSQLYKCAGNSIVVACLHDIFRELFYPTYDVADVDEERDGFFADFFAEYRSEQLATASEGRTAIPHTKEKPLQVVTLCSGYDSQCMALDRLAEEHPDDFAYDLIAWSEIDKYAIAAHNLVYPQWSDRNVGDMTKVDWTPYKGKCDLLTYLLNALPGHFTGGQAARPGRRQRHAQRHPLAYGKGHRHPASRIRAARECQGSRQ